MTQARIVVGRRRTVVLYALCVIAAPLALSTLGLEGGQVLATAGFCMILFGAIFFWRQRLTFAFAGVALLLATDLLDVEHLIEFAGLEIILFLAATMLIIGFLEENQFFEVLIERLLALVGPHPVQIMGVLMLTAAVAAALVGEVTSILFMIAALLNLLGRSRVNPVPFVLMLVLATNIGSSATAVGNPVGVIIALESGLTFVDFLRWATPISLICLGLAIPICLHLFRDDIDGLKHVLTGTRGERRIEHVAAEEQIPRGGFRRSAILFSAVIVGLVLHHPLEEMLGLEPNTMLLGVALLGAAAALAMSGGRAREMFEERVDWWTLGFFMLLFASVGTLGQQGVTEVIAQRLIALSDGNLPLLTTIFAWAAGLLTAFMDNVLAVATFVPIIEDAGDAGISTFPLWWATLFGGTLMGNATLIGSTANIVAVGALERRGLGEITFMQWLRPGLLVAIPTMVVANVLLLIQLPLMPDT